MPLHVGWAGNRPRFHASDFNGLLHRHGITVSWEEGILCSCWGTVDGGQLTYQTREPDPYCKLCRGEGYSYKEPKIFDGVVLQKMDFNLMFNVMGQYENGDMQMTVPSDTPIWSKGAQGDRITIMDRYVTQFEEVVKGKDILRYVPAEMQSVQWGDTVYNLGTDYHIEGDEIVWVGNQPPDGVWYGVRFFTYPVFQLWLRLPQPRVIDRVELPERWWVVYRESYQKRLKEGVPGVVTETSNSSNIGESSPEFWS